MNKKSLIWGISLIAVIIIAPLLIYTFIFWRYEPKMNLEADVNIKINNKKVDISDIQIECIDTNGKKYSKEKIVDEEGNLKFSIMQEEKMFFHYYFKIPKQKIFEESLESDVLIYKLTVYQKSDTNTTGDIEININEIEKGKWESIFEAGISFDTGREKTYDMIKTNIDRDKESQKIRLAFGA